MFEVGGSLYEPAISLQHVSVLNRQLCVLSVCLLEVRWGHTVIQGLLQCCYLICSHFLKTKQKTGLSEVIALLVIMLTPYLWFFKKKLLYLEAFDTTAKLILRGKLNFWLESKTSNLISIWFVCVFPLNIVRQKEHHFHFMYDVWKDLSYLL